MDGRKALDQEVGGQVGHVEVDAVCAGPLHLHVDAAGDDVARRERAHLMQLAHEGLAGRVPKFATLAAQRFGDEEALGARLVEAGRMKLHELEVGDRAAGTVGHGDTVAGRDVRIGGVEIDLARTAGGQNGVARQHGAHLAGPLVEHVGADAAVAVGGLCPESPEGDEVDGDGLFGEADVGVATGSLKEHCRDGLAGDVARMQYPALAVASFAAKVEGAARLIKGHADV